MMHRSYSQCDFLLFCYPIRKEGTWIATFLDRWIDIILFHSLSFWRQKNAMNSWLLCRVHYEQPRSRYSYLTFRVSKFSLHLYNDYDLVFSYSFILSKYCNHIPNERGNLNARISYVYQNIRLESACAFYFSLPQNVNRESCRVSPVS